jgi:hypothetical protein
MISERVQLQNGWFFEARTGVNEDWQRTLLLELYNDQGRVTHSFRLTPHDLQTLEILLLLQQCLRPENVRYLEHVVKKAREFLEHVANARSAAEPQRAKTSRRQRRP